MPVCSRCGQPIEFRYVDGRCVPIHPLGGCSGGHSNSPANTYSGHLRSTESTCFETTCPECGERVFFIRHNRGSVWIDPPLGAPWYKHWCMDAGPSAPLKPRSSLLHDFAIPKERLQPDLIIGVATEAEPFLSGETTILKVQAGAKDEFDLLIKNSAGFLVGRMVVFDRSFEAIQWIENEMYTFKILAPLHYPKDFDYPRDAMVQCPECSSKMKAKNLRKHFRKKHPHLMN